MKRILLFLFLALLFPFPLSANSPFESFQSAEPFLPKLKINVVTDRAVVFPGEEFKFYVSIFIEEGWHIYSLNPFKGSETLATQILIAENVFQELKAWKEPEPVLIQDGAIGRMVKGHKGNIEFSRTYSVPAGVEASEYSIEGKLVYRACDNSLCTLPQIYPFKTPINVGSR